MTAAGDRRRDILLLTTNYGPNVRGTPLFDDLARCLARRGHRVHVSVLDWSARGDTGIARWRQDDGVTVTAVPPLRIRGRAGLIAKWLLSSLRAARADRDALRRSYDLAVAISPLTAMALPIVAATRGAGTRYCYITDFFPWHQAALGLFPAGAVARGAAWVEGALLRRFDIVGCMSPLGVDYLRRRYRLRRDQSSEVLPLWSDMPPPAQVDRTAVRAAWHLPDDRPIAVFGGQIAPGRGIEDILAAAEIARTRDSRTLFMIVGDGPLRPMVESAVAGNPGIALRPGAPRDDYVRLLGACDVGLVATVADVDVPTFPSKSLDYLRAGLPIVASIERSTDFGEFLHAHGIGDAVEAGSGERLLDGVEALLADPARRTRMALAARRAAVETFHVEQAANRLLDHVDRRERRQQRGDGR